MNFGVTRRDALVAAGVGLAASAVFAMAPKGGVASPKRILPRALQDGDRIALVCCSSAYDTPKDYDVARQLVERLRCTAEFGVHSAQVDEIFAGSDEQRVADLHRAFADPGIKAIILIRGGYGAQRILDLIDYDLIRRNPKIVIGYSDVTALLVAIQNLTGLVTFHGPVASSSSSFFSETWMRHMLGDSKPVGTFAQPAGKNFELVTVRSGRGRGPLTGGNLTMLSTSLGTPYEVDTRGKLLVIEDIGEAPYRVDRMLNQLRLAGKFEQCNGIVVGQFVDCDPKNPADKFTWQRALEDQTARLVKPVVRGFAIGHIRDKVTLPFGCVAELDGSARTLTMLEGAVAPA